EKSSRGSSGTDFLQIVTRIGGVARRYNCRRLDHEHDAFFGCPRAMHHALWDNKALIGQELNRLPLEIDYESAAQDVKKLIIIVVFVPVVLALHYAEPHDGIVHPAKRLIVPLVGDRLCKLIDIDQSEGVELYVEMRRVGKGFRFCHPQSPIVGSRGVERQAPCSCTAPLVSRREPAQSRMIAGSRPEISRTDFASVGWE